jgi:hypothetical protein
VVLRLHRVLVSGRQRQCARVPSPLPPLPPSPDLSHTGVKPVLSAIRDAGGGRCTLQKKKPSGVTFFFLEYRARRTRSSCPPPVSRIALATLATRCVLSQAQHPDLNPKPKSLATLATRCVLMSMQPKPLNPKLCTHWLRWQSGFVCLCSTLNPKPLCPCPT